MAIVRVNHVDLAVEDLDQALDFHRRAFGLEEVGTQNGTVYLGHGGGPAYIVGLSAGGTGVRHFAVEVESAEDLDTYEQRLSGMGVEVQRQSDGEPGQQDSLRFTAPSGHTIELVPSAGEAPRLGGSVAPLGLDHITLRTGNPRELAEWLREALDCKISDAAVAPPLPGGWAAAWTRFGSLHHDVAMMASPPPQASETLDHVAWTMRDCEHYRQAADALSELEIPLEAGIGRHRLGGNMFAYFWSPGGNRYEFSGAMPRVENIEPGLWEDFATAFSAWGQLPPESFSRGS
jgi:catechol 2,3-dioxygenase